VRAFCGKEMAVNCLPPEWGKALAKPPMARKPQPKNCRGFWQSCRAWRGWRRRASAQTVWIWRAIASPTFNTETEDRQGAASHCGSRKSTCNQVTARFCGRGHFERTLLFLITFGVYPWYGKKAKDTCHAQSTARGAPWTSRERPTSCDSQFHRF